MYVVDCPPTLCIYLYICILCIYRKLLYFNLKCNPEWNRNSKGKERQRLGKLNVKKRN